jgi:large subunit ribosomal protein L15
LHSPSIPQVLGTGELKAGLTVHAASFSESAKAKIEAAGGKAEVVAAKTKWTKKGHKKMVSQPLL